MAAYDDDGTMLNAAVSLTTVMDPSATAARQAYRVQQELLDPLNATSIRLAVRDTNADRIGAMTIRLPLQPEIDKEQHTAAR